jgi:hypothetical protein
MDCGPGAPSELCEKEVSNRCAQNVQLKKAVKHRLFQTQSNSRSEKIPGESFWLRRIQETALAHRDSVFPTDRPNFCRWIYAVFIANRRAFSSRRHGTLVAVFKSENYRSDLIEFISAKRQICKLNFQEEGK